jgi:hypothetical protein
VDIFATRTAQPRRWERRWAGPETQSAPKKEDMARLKEDLMKAMGKMKDFDKLKKLIEITVTPEGLADRVDGGSAWDFLRDRKRGANPNSTERTENTLPRGGQVAEYDLNRRPHRFQALFRGEGLRQLGAIDRSCKYSPAPDGK